MAKRKASNQIDAFQVAPYERVALLARLLAAYLEAPHDSTRTNISRGMREYQDAWIENLRAWREGEIEGDSLGQVLINELRNFADQAMDGSLIEPDEISPDVQDMLNRLRGGIDPRAGEGGPESEPAPEE